MIGPNNTNLANGKNGSLSTRDRGDEDGDETHTLTESELAQHDHALSQESHAHSISDSGHDHDVTGAGDVGGANNTVGVGDSGSIFSGTRTSTSETTGVSTVGNDANVTADNAGSGSAHENMSPFGVANYLIKT